MMVTETQQTVPTFKRDDLTGEVLYKSSDGRLLVLAGTTGMGWRPFHRFWFPFEDSRVSDSVYRVPEDVPWVRLEDTPELYPLAFGYMMSAWRQVRDRFTESRAMPAYERPSGTVNRELVNYDDWRGR